MTPRVVAPLGPAAITGAAAALLVLLAGCGQARPGGPGSGIETAAAGASSPIPTVEPTCAADYPQYGDLAGLVGAADLIVRVTATGPSRDDEVRSDPHSDTELPPRIGTAFDVQVTEVVKGPAEVGDVLEVDQNDCTARPLPTGPHTDYVLALHAWEPGEPMDQLNDSQAAWQVDDDRSLRPVNPSNDLDVETLDDLVATATAQQATG